MTDAEGSSSARVLLVAPFDHVLNAHSSLRQRALERLGCSVRPFNVLGGIGWLRRFRRRDLATRLARILSKNQFDAVIVIGTRAFGADDVNGLRQGSDCGWLWWSPDAPPAGASVDDTVRAYDHVFVGATDVAAALTERAGRPVHYLPPACDPSFHRPLRSRDRFRANVVFAGRASPRREALLTEVVEFGLAVWGRGWRRTALRAYCRGERLSDLDYVRAYAGASVALNIHRESGESARDAGCNQRVFELAAMGAAQVVDRRQDTELHFVRNQELVEFEDAAVLKESVRALLQDPPAAETMGRNARAVALGEHTYMHRMVELLRFADLA
ncbi:MAG: glycosyltransferase [Gemmatimonadales bacterium]